MKLTDLEPSFLVIEEPGKTHRKVDEIAGADGVVFLCPKCFKVNGGPRRTHQVLCWAMHVPVDGPNAERPGPGRWALVGTGYDDLTLRNGSSSVLLQGGCGAHFHVTNGEVTDA